MNDTSPAGVHDRLDIVIKQKAYRATSGGSLHVLDELAITLAGGEVAALVGPSGCGKTTLLRIIAGLDRDFDGHITLPAHGTLGMVFQEPRLLPWRTVEQNVRLAAPNATDANLDALFATLGLADRLLVLSASPARVVADVPVARPRTSRSAEEIAAIVSEVARRSGA